MVLRHDGTNAYRTVLSDLTVAFPYLQPLPGGDLLVVGARCHRFAGGTAERNAWVYAADGAPSREMVLGDGIADVQVTAKGAIWVSYFDEGILGNFGWGGQGAPPIGATGLVHFDRFDAHGAKQWEFHPPPGLNVMFDCYALNVASDVVWAYYYTEFPLVRITPDGRTRGWRSEVPGATAFATDGRRSCSSAGIPRTGPVACSEDLGRRRSKTSRSYRWCSPTDGRSTAGR